MGHYRNTTTTRNYPMTQQTDPTVATTLPQLIRAAAARYGDATAITLESNEGQIDALSFVELERQSARIARGLLARGVGKGSRVGFIYGNNPSFAVMFAAIARIGAVRSEERRVGR